MSGVADSSNTLAEAATIDNRGAVGQHALAGDQPVHDLAGERQAARALVGGLGADDRVGDACDIVVLHVAADAAHPVHDRHADPPKMLGIADPGQLQDVRRADRARRHDPLARRLGGSIAAPGPPRENSMPVARLP